jgi:hypothetical protein
MPLRNYNCNLSVSVSVSEGKCNKTNFGEAHSQTGILRILLGRMNIPAVRMLVTDKVAGAVNKINVEV